jgi:hypothetical protein
MKTCSRCGKEIQCGAEIGAPICWCADMPKLKPIPARYTDCLCLECLKLFAESSDVEMIALKADVSVGPD